MVAHYPCRTQRWLPRKKAKAPRDFFDRMERAKADAEATKSALPIYLYLATRCNRTSGICKVLIATIASDTQRSPRIVSRALAALRAAGLIQVTHCRPEVHSASIYTVNEVKGPFVMIPSRFCMETLPVNAWRVLLVLCAQDRKWKLDPVKLAKKAGIPRKSVYRAMDAIRDQEVLARGGPYNAFPNLTDDLFWMVTIDNIPDRPAPRNAPPANVDEDGVVIDWLSGPAPGCRETGTTPCRETGGHNQSPGTEPNPPRAAGTLGLVGVDVWPTGPPGAGDAPDGSAGLLDGDDF